MACPTCCKLEAQTELEWPPEVWAVMETGEPWSLWLLSIVHERAQLSEQPGVPSMDPSADLAGEAEDHTG